MVKLNGENKDSLYLPNTFRGEKLQFGSFSPLQQSFSSLFQWYLKWDFCILVISIIADLPW